MLRDLQQILRTAGIPLGDEELLDALWLVSRLPEGPDTPLAARLAAAQEASDHHAEGALRVAAPIQPGDHLMPPQPARAPVPGSESDTSQWETLPDAKGLTPLVGARHAGDPADFELRVPGLKALGSDLAFSRALRPLKRRIPSAFHTELDEAATAAAQADTRVPQVVLQPQPERWLRLTLIIDSAASMLLWERHCAELLAVFHRSGAFRQTEVHQLRYHPPHSQQSVVLTRPWDSERATALPPHCVTDPSGRTMVVVVTDGAAPAWHDGRMHAVLKNWATAGPTALIHVLPRHLWAGTGVAGDTWHITTPRPGAPNIDWHVAHPILPPALSGFPAPPIPVIELTPPGLAAWATALTTLGQPVPLRLWEPRSAPARPTATATVRAFSRTASPQAVRLAAHLAAMAPLTVPVMQLVHSCLPGSDRTTALAEVFLGGLLKPLAQAGQSPAGIRHRLFDFTAEAKDLLLDTVATAELISCSRRVGERMERLVGRSPDFPAWLLQPSQKIPLTDRPQPFAHIGQSLLTRLGRGNNPDLPEPDLENHRAAGPHPTVVVLTAHPLAYEAVHTHLTDTETLVHAPTGTRARRGRLPGTPWYVALAQIGEGASTTATIIERIHTWLKPQALFFVSVAGGLKDNIKIGDVVVATEAYRISGVKHTAEGFSVRPQAWRSSKRLEEAARHALRGQAHFKPIAVGDVAFSDATSGIARHLAEHYNDAAAVDMEGTGIAQATRLADTLIICGISGTADSKQPTSPTTAHRRAAENAAVTAAVTILHVLKPSTARIQEPQLPPSASQAAQDHAGDDGSIGRIPDLSAGQPTEGEFPEETAAARERHGSQNGGIFFHMVMQGQDIPVQLPSRTPLSLSGLPPTSPAFTGRERQVQELLASLAPDVAWQQPLLVAGLAGVGKTELVVQAANRSLKQGWFPGGVLFVDLSGYDTERRLSPERALEGLLRAMGMPDTHIPPDLQDRVRLYRSVLAAFAEQGQRILVVIDNAATAEQAGLLLPTDGITAALLTSRHSLDLEARHFDLTFLDEHDSIEVLRQALHQAHGAGDTRIEDAPEAASTIAQLCAGHPLALRIAASLLADTPTRPLASFAQALQNANTRLEQLRRKNRTVLAVFDLSYQLLDDEHARLFRLLPLNPGPDLSTEAAAHLAGAEASQLEELLRDLARAHLIESGPSWGRWRLHDLVRLYADQQGVEHANNDRRETARARLFEYYRDTAHAADALLAARPAAPSSRFPDRAAALAWLDSERLNLIATVTTAPGLGHPSTSTTLASALARYLSDRELFDDWIAITTTALAASRETGDRRNEVTLLSNLGTALTEVGRFDEAIEAHSRAASVFRELGDHHSEARALNSLGTALAKAHRSNEATEAHSQAAAVLRELGNHSSAAEAAAEGGAVRLATGHELAGEEDSPRVVPYAMTGGRTRPRYQLAIEALVVTTADPAQIQGLLPEHQRICHLCHEVKSVAEISAILNIPLGVARILVADLAEAGLVALNEPVGDERGLARPNVTLMERVLSRLREL